MLARVSTLVGIGDFSRMTFLSVKALRHYHEVGLLPPAEIDLRPVLVDRPRARSDPSARSCSPRRLP
jgi:MerR family regulatory protein